MVVAPRVFVVAMAICRAGVVSLSAAALACTVRAPDVSFTPLIFLKLALLLQLLWNVPRLLYEAAQVFLQIPLPPHRTLFSALAVAEAVVMLVLFAAGSSSTAVLVFFQIDTRACGSSVLPVPCSYWHGASAALTLWAWFFSFIVSVLTF